MNVVFLESTKSYGYGFSAGSSKVSMMVKGLQAAGATCYIHNGLTGSTCVDKDEVKYVDGVEVTTYKSFSNGYVYYFWLPIKNMHKLWKYLKSHRDKESKNIMILEVPVYHIFVLYCILGRLLSYRIACIAHEWIPTLHHKGKIDRYYNDPLYTSTFGYFVHALLPISEYIIDKCKHFKKPYFKLPALAEFPPLQPKEIDDGQFFLYCAQAGYFRIVKFIIDAYRLYHDNGGHYTLTMVLAGTEPDINKARQYVSSLQLEKFVNIETKLPYEILLSRYRNASALLIPLDPDYEQDSARFPQKIAEYTAASSPIISTDIGEIKSYFSNNNCIKAEFTEESFSNSLTWVEANPEKSKEVGKEGYALGKEKFNCMKVCKDMLVFFNNI